MAERVSREHPLEITRKRAWLLLSVEEDVLAKADLNSLFLAGGDDYTVIRVDEVRFEDGGEPGWNVVIPVDAKDDDAFGAAKERVEALFDTSAKIAAVVKEGGHHPWPPHNAHGYITEEEFLRGSQESDFWHGLQGNSPGRNPWG